MAGRLVKLRPVDADAGNVHVPAANTAAVLTFAAVVGQRHVFIFIVWSYSGAPTGGRLTITDGGTTVLDIDITAGGPGDLAPQLRGEINSAMVVTLAAGGAGITGKLNVYKYTEAP